MNEREKLPIDGSTLLLERARSRPLGLVRWIEAGIITMALVAGLLYTGRISDQSVSPTPSTPVEEFRIVPVRVHLLRTNQGPAAGTKLTRDDIVHIFHKANGIWHPAGIHLWVESVVEEEAVHTSHQDDWALPQEALLALRPPGSLARGMFHVYYVGRMEINGIYLQRDGLFIAETARLNAVPGGIDEPLPRVTAHELGHALGLPHRQAKTNLMASGTTGTLLNEKEIETARHVCYGLSWVQSAEEFLKMADGLSEKDNREEARARYQAVLDLPGVSILKERAKERLAAL